MNSASAKVSKKLVAAKAVAGGKLDSPLRAHGRTSQDVRLLRNCGRLTQRIGSQDDIMKDVDPGEYGVPRIDRFSVGFQVMGSPGDHHDPYRFCICFKSYQTQLSFIYSKVPRKRNGMVLGLSVFSTFRSKMLLGWTN